MEIPSAAGTTYRNRILASLSGETIRNLAPHLQPVTLKVNQILYSPNQKVQDVYFLESGICSIVVNLKDGSTVEVGIIGREGFVGAPVVLGTSRSPNSAFIQIAGTGYKV